MEDNMNEDKQLVIANTLPSEHEMMVFKVMADAAEASRMYGSIGGKGGVMMIMLSARELGIPPCQALNGGINLIKGKIEISARMMNALIRRAGHQLTTVELEDTHCTVMGKRCDTGETQTLTYSIKDAQKAGLVKSGGGWEKFPKDMLFARAMSRLARQLFSDVIGIGYVEGEIKDGEILDVKPIEAPIEEPKPPVECSPEQYKAFVEKHSGDYPKTLIKFLTKWAEHHDITLYATVFNLSNDLERFNRLFAEYKDKYGSTEKEVQSV